MEADLQHHYQVDLRDLWRGGLTLRRLRVLLDGLPPDSLWWTAMRHRPDAPPPQPGRGDVEAVRWGTSHELLAALIDATNAVGWAVFQSQSRKKIPPPKPFPRPQVGPVKARTGMSQATRDRIRGWITASRLNSPTPTGEDDADGD